MKVAQVFKLVATFQDEKVATEYYLYWLVSCYVVPETEAGLKQWPERQGKSQPLLPTPVEVL